MCRFFSGPKMTHRRWTLVWQKIFRFDTGSTVQIHTPLRPSRAWCYKTDEKFIAINSPILFTYSDSESHILPVRPCTCEYNLLGGDRTHLYVVPIRSTERKRKFGNLSHRRRRPVDGPFSPFIVDIVCESGDPGHGECTAHFTTPKEFESFMMRFCVGGSYPHVLRSSVYSIVPCK